MRIEVLGPVRLSTDGGIPVEVAERHLRLLLASLVTANGEPVSADSMIDRLWDADLPADPKKVLQAKLSRLRATLDRARPGARGLLTHTPAGYRLAVESDGFDVPGAPDAIDADLFKSGVERARRMGSSQRKAESLAEVLDLWRGQPFGDASDEIWLAPAVAELREVRGDALESLVGTLVEQGDPQRALSLAGGAFEEYATREGLVSSAMTALYQLGRQREALEMFESLRRRLAEELGVDPTPAVRELHRHILRQDPALASEPGAETARPHSLTAHSRVPAETGPLIGRRQESEQIGALLADARLVTLNGIGGVGKTRLALHLARGQAYAYERGTWFIDLTELTTTPANHRGAGERIAALTAATIGLPENPGTTSTLDRLSEAIGSRSALLVLDNCEHVVSEVSAFTAELLRRAAGVRVLATSREPLGLPEEQRYEIGTLSTEPGDGDGDGGGPSEAVEFFAARARAGDRSFRLDADTVDAVAELCRRLDGLPLALELAAARIRGLPVSDLLARLSDRLNILRRPGHAVPRRQQTLRGMIDWSWSLLDDTERVVLRRLAVHPGTMGLEAAEAICCGEPADPGGPGVDRADVIDALLGLVDRSLVTTTSTPTGVRYGLLESIAAYAGEKLDASAERAATAQRHLNYYLDLARAADTRLRGPEQRQWLPRLEAEHTQLRNAFDEAVRRGDGANAAAMAVATFWYQWISGLHSDLADKLRTAAELSGPRDDTYATAAALAVAMDVCSRPEDADGRVVEALRLFEDEGARARAQWFAGSSLLASGLREAGERHIDEAVEVLLATGQGWDAAVAAGQRDWFVASQWGGAPRGLPDGRDPGEIIRASADAYGLSQVHAVRYCTAEVIGDHAGSALAAEQALEICLDLGLRAEANYWLNATAIAAVRSGDTALATERLAEARSLARDIAHEEGLRFADFGAALVARHQGELGEARALLDRWLDYIGPAASPEAAQNANAYFESGFLAVQEGDLNRARDALDAFRVGGRGGAGAAGVSGDSGEPGGSGASGTAGTAGTGGTAQGFGALVSDARPSLTARVLELMAAVRAAGGDEVPAAELLGTATSVRARAGAEPSAPEDRDIQRVQQHLEERLSAAELSDAIARGRAADPLVHLRAVV